MISLALKRAGLWICLILALGVFTSGKAAAEIRPSADVLLPYFEVGLTPDQPVTTLFALCNSGDKPRDVLISVTTNWGIPVITFTHRLEADQTLSVNLRDWILDGHLPGRTLTPEELAHVQAALSGAASPRDGLYYGTEMAAGKAVGAVTMRSRGSDHMDVLWGDSFVVDPSIDLFEGETLVGLDPTPVSDALCKRHGLRFLEAGPFEDGTELLIWTDRRWAPSPTPDPRFGMRVAGSAAVYDEPGRHVEDRSLALLPVQSLRVKDLTLTPPFGWLDIVTEERSFIGAHYTSILRPSAALHSYCLPEEAGFQGPALQLEKTVNGDSADDPPGPSIAVGTAVAWEYLVTNIGTVPLFDIQVTDDAGLTVTCPQTSLDPQELMVCTAPRGAAAACQQQNVGRADAVTLEGVAVSAEDAAHYFGQASPSLDIETMIAGEEADTPPGPRIAAGQPVPVTYRVTNSGDVALTEVTVTDDQGLVVTCPKTPPGAALAPHETMTCTASGTASGPGQHRHVGTVTGKPPCGPNASASDPGHYFVPGPPAIALRKLTNGQDVAAPPGPTIEAGQPVAWQYEVTNIGEVALHGVAVTDDHVAVGCPKTVLEPGESMICGAKGTAEACQYTNVGTATGTPAEGPSTPVTAQDTSYYFGRHHAAITLQKSTNGEAADQPPGPILTEGDAVQWTYAVTNSGDVPLTGVTVSDDRGVSVTCPKTSLAVGESMVCTASGHAIRGQYRNVGTATGTPPCGENVIASDPSHYLGVRPDISIEKLINGQDADNPPGLFVRLGDPLLWSYVVTNLGDVALSTVRVVDDQGVTVTCPGMTLAAGASMVCTGSGTARAGGPYCNIGTVSGVSPQKVTVSAQDSSCYKVISPAIRLVKKTNGQHVEAAPGPTIYVGKPVTWTYEVTNTGDITLSPVTVSDNRDVAVSCPKSTLAPGETMTCTGSGVAVLGQYHNIGMATGMPPDDHAVTAQDDSYYKGCKLPDEGCSHGYWKTHSSSWPATGYSTSQKVSSVFSEAWRYSSLANDTLMEALYYSGGPGTTGAAESLLKQAVAAVLNAAHPGINFPLTPAEVISSVNAALASQSRDTMLVLASQLDAYNNLSCPLH